MSEKLPHGKVCYLEIPTNDVAKSVAFYQTLFNWKTRKRGDGATAFDDAAGYVSGAWVTGRPAVSTAGLLVYINVDSVDATLDKVIPAGGTITQPLGIDAPEITARILDPFGNILGLYQNPG
jgi:predicted enzyme related to lactoylglutathione lyase